MLSSAAITPERSSDPERAALADAIELLTPALLAEQRGLVECFRLLSRELRVGLGWHYLLDLPWAAAKLEALARPGARALDAGAGRGLMQWHLARRGVDVVSVDRAGRRMPTHLHRHFRIRGLRREDSPPAARWRGAWVDLAGRVRGRRAPGEVTLYHRDLAELAELPDASLDFAVSISALEHNPPEALHGVVAELLRTLKPGAPLVASVGAARDRDWFHEPSRGWCFGAGTLRDLFQLDSGCPDDFEDYAAALAALRECAELRDGLDPMYRASGDNGMPWGRWDPQYLSVGVVKVKPGG